MKYFTALITLYLLLFPLTYCQSSRHIQVPSRAAGKMMQVNVDNAAINGNLSAATHSNIDKMGELLADPIKFLQIPL